MPYNSRWPLDPPKISLPSFVFGSLAALPPDDVIFSDAKRPDTHFMTPYTFREWSRRMAGGLVAAGLRPSDRVVLMSGNDIWIPVVVLGTLMANCVYTSCNPANTARETANQLRDCEPSIIFAAEACIPVVLQALKELHGAKPQVFLFESSNLEPSNLDTTSSTMTCDGVLHWSKCFEEPRAANPYMWNIGDSNAAANKTAMLLYSSGTTGLPKGVEATHRNLITTCQQFQIMQFSNTTITERRGICVLPMYHGLGLVYYCFIGPSAGLKAWIQPRFNLEEMLESIERYKITELLLVPPILLMMAQSPLCKQGKYDLSSIKKVVAGAAPLGLQLTQDFEELWSGKLRVHQAWGMSELPCVGLSWNESEGLATSSISVGELVPGLSAKLVDENDAEIVEPGVRGELWIAGPNVMKGYWHNKQATEQTLTSDGWLKTGDIAYVDANGKWFIVDRKKELIKVRGAQVAPAELEALLMEHPDILDAAVIGMPTETGDEKPRAYVVQRAKNLCARKIDEFLAPKISKVKRLTGGVVFVASIPKTPSGKILRKILREQANSATSTRSHEAKL